MSAKPEPVASYSEVEKAVKRLVGGSMSMDDSREPKDGQCGLIEFSTRNSGNVAEETPGEHDIRMARKLAVEIEQMFPNVRCRVSTCDEWTNLEIRVHNCRLAPRHPGRRMLREALYAEKPRLDCWVKECGWTGVQEYITDFLPPTMILKRPDDSSISLDLSVNTREDTIKSWAILIEVGNLNFEMPELVFSQSDLHKHLEAIFETSEGLELAGARFYFGSLDTNVAPRNFMSVRGMFDSIGKREADQLVWAVLPSGDRVVLDSDLLGRLENGGAFARVALENKRLDDGSFTYERVPASKDSWKWRLLAAAAAAGDEFVAEQQGETKKTTQCKP